MANVESVRQQVGEWLTSTFNGVTTPEGFDFLVPSIGSTAAFVDILTSGEHVIVSVSAPVLLDVAVNGELLHYIGSRAGDFIFGHLCLVGEGRQQTLIFRHSILGDDLDQSELLVTLSVIASTADELDNDLQLRFGGRLFGA